MGTALTFMKSLTLNEGLNRLLDPEVLYELNTDFIRLAGNLVHVNKEA